MTIRDVLFKHGIHPDELMCGPVSCEDGWSGLIDELITDLIAIGWDRELRDCKQKLGSLRFYVNNDTITRAMRLLIQDAERQSHFTCELCGGGVEPDPMESGNMWSWYCDACEAKRNLASGIAQ